MAAGDNTYLQSDGKSVDVTLSSTVADGQVAYVEGWLGVAIRGGESGDEIALNIDRREYQFDVPTALAVSKGDTVYIDTTDLTGHIPDEAGYAKAAGANLKALFKATSDQDANDVVTGILLPEGV